MKSMKNIEIKKEIARNEQFLLFSQCFSFYRIDNFLPLISAETREKSSPWHWKEMCVSTGVRKPGNTCASPTALIWP